jgi:hypothetical protein
MPAATFLPKFMPAAVCCRVASIFLLLSAFIFACCRQPAFLATVLHSFSPPPATYILSRCLPPASLLTAVRLHSFMLPFAVAVGHFFSVVVRLHSFPLPPACSLACCHPLAVLPAVVELCCGPYSAGVLRSVSDQIQNLSYCSITPNKMASEDDIKGSGQTWAKLLRLLTVNSLSYFVKIKY